MPRSPRNTLLLVLIASLGVLLTMPAASSARIKAKNRLFVNMIGDNEPAGGDPDGDGFGMVDLRERRRRVCFSLQWTDVAEPITEAHIHRGAEGVAGDVKVPLWGPDQSGGSAADCVPNVSRSLIRNLREHPRRYYVNLHNAGFPDGAIRGQLFQSAPVCGGRCWLWPPHPPSPGGG